jgi:hypothetical protein
LRKYIATQEHVQQNLQAEKSATPASIMRTMEPNVAALLQPTGSSTAALDR